MAQTYYSRYLFFILFAVVLLPVVFSAAGQNTNRQLENAQRQLNSGNFIEAERIASGILKKDSTFLQAYFFLADLYHQADSVASEVKILKALLHHSGQTNPLFFFRLGKALYQTGQYAEASEWFDKYLSVQKTGSGQLEEVLKLAGNCKFAIQAIKHPVLFDPIKLGMEVNTPDDEYWPTISIDGKTLVFTRLIKQTAGNLFPQEDFFTAKGESGEWHSIKPITDVNTEGNEGAQSLSADGKWLFFTACNRNDGRGSCDIYYSQFTEGKWSPPEPVRGQINTSGWEGQPSISADAHYLYFSSDRKGGKGGKDIWCSYPENYGPGGIQVWSKPENLGDSINSSGDEISPFIHPDGTDLYFSSDHWPGMGGLDLFHVRLKNDLTWTSPQNLGYPLNTIKNEQGLVIDANGETAFFASGRDKITGMDIYSFKIDKKFQPVPVTYVKAKVIDSRTNMPLKAEVRLENLNNHTSEIFITDADGQIFACLPVGSDYAFQVSKEDFLFYSENFPLKEKRSSFEPYLLLIKLNPLNKGQTMNLYNIFFATSSSDFMPESIPELEKLYGLLSDNGELKVEIQGHTDTTGTREYNQLLSEKRAFSVMNYLISKGIQSKRLSAKGYGYDIPLASNETEEGRRQNRRTTILIQETK